MEKKPRQVAVYCTAEELKFIKGVLKHLNINRQPDEKKISFSRFMLTNGLEKAKEILKEIEKDKK